MNSFNAPDAPSQCAEHPPDAFINSVLHIVLALGISLFAFDFRCITVTASIIADVRRCRGRFWSNVDDSNCSCTLLPWRM